jgi:ABC-type branched-subunit amino acid transport system ATPase component
MPSTTLPDLSRLQFAITAAFHMTFPAITVGPAVFLVVTYRTSLKTGNPVSLQIFRFPSAKHGAALSGGQRRRLSIAQALLRRPDSDPRSPARRRPRDRRP